MKTRSGSESGEYLVINLSQQAILSTAHGDYSHLQSTKEPDINTIMRNHPYELGGCDIDAGDVGTVIKARLIP